MVTVPRETPSLPNMLRDDLAWCHGQKFFGKLFSARKRAMSQLSLSMFPFGEAEKSIFCFVLNSTTRAIRRDEVMLLLVTECLQLHLLELREL